MRSADKAMLASCVVVAVSTAGLPFVRGYGTGLFQLVAFGAWAVIAKLSSGVFADQHHGLQWTVALFLDLFCFCIVAVPLWLVTRNRLPKISAFSIIGWTVLYVVMLFVSGDYWALIFHRPKQSDNSGRLIGALVAKLTSLQDSRRVLLSRICNRFQNFVQYRNLPAV